MYFGKSIVTRWNSCVLIALSLAASAAAAKESSTVIYRIDVQNITGGNVLSPFLAVVHNARFQVAKLGTMASAGLAALAETGNRMVLTNELRECGQASVVEGAEGGPLQPGETRSLQITVPKATVTAGAKLEVLAMIGRSNDSIIALSGFSLSSLSRDGKFSMMKYATNYDAGSEGNSGNLEDFGPAGHPTDEAEGKISIDRGLNLRGDAPELYGWGPAAAAITITKMN